jgi:hypothetical protein
MTTDKQRVLAALEGRPVDRYPVTVLYNQLYNRDHFEELTGEPQWQMWPWLVAQPGEYLKLYLRMVERAPFEILQPDDAPSRAERENTEFVEKDGRRFRRNKKEGTLTPLPEPISGHAFDDRPHQTQYVFDKQDVDEQVKIVKAEKLIASGVNDYIEAAVAALGKDHFILSGGVIGVLYSCSWYVGLTNLYGLLIEQADLIDYLCQKILEKNM